MFKKINNLIKYLKTERTRSRKDKINNSNYNKEIIPKKLEVLNGELKVLFEDSNDFVLRNITLGNDHGIKIAISYIDGLVDKQIINDNILRPLMIESKNTSSKNNIDKTFLMGILEYNIITSSEIKKTSNFKETIEATLSGDTIIYIDGSSQAFMVSTKGWKARSITEPKTESVIRGPREGFVETLRTNTSMLRRKIRNPKLKFENVELGVRTNTEVCICYIKGIADEDVIKTVKRRLSYIDTDAILESGYIEQFIEDAPLSIFPTIGSSEKPDKVASKLLEGRIAILCDGTPFVLTVPYLFIESIQTSEDYYNRTIFGSVSRFLRFIALLITTLLPAIYVALISFHTNVIPVKLLLSVAESREGIPFSPLLEALFMLIVFELLREAGLRMPRPIGQAVSIVGALVLGDAAVKAGLVSNIMIIIVALTGICSFIVPAISNSVFTIRILILIGANILGFLGMLLVLLFLLLHMCSLRSFGVPYMAPFAPFTSNDLKDTLIRLPLWLMLKRPRALTWKNSDKYRMEKKTVKKED
ncbi:spore germination protein [Dethiothermospora halolimnae]|uniref:spore germination protein n=1 Tax=Dethiothermospora halolimnae TaxID=3114390 RepID=UPI003CCC20BA